MPVAATPVADIVALHILFAFDSAELSPETIPTVKILGEALNNPELKTSCIRIEGHTDSIGAEEYNLTLSQRRAQSVVQYLVKHMGVAEEQLIVVGKGENEPVADNDTEAGRQRNRRVQIVNLGRPQLTAREH
jgi:OOP family OmpA-OmpF porin